MSDAAHFRAGRRSVGLIMRGSALVFAGLLSACAALPEEPASTTVAQSAPPVSAPRPGENPEHDRILETYGGVYQSPGIERSIAAMTGRLVAASEDPSQVYRITILNSPTVNAFALPDGFLYVTRGLLALANDASEVAAVLAHEMSHVTADHATARRRRAEATALVNRVLANVVRDREVADAARTSSQLSFARFSQAQELEADKVSIKTLAGAGFDPYAASRFLRTMGRFAELRWSASSQSNKPDFLSSHPTTPQRIDDAVRSARQIGAPGLGKTGKASYLRSLDGMLFGDDPSEGFVRGRRFMHKALRIAFTVPKGFVLENTTRAVLATDGGTIAVRFDGIDLAADMTLTDYLKSGWLNGLAEPSIRIGAAGDLETATASAVTQGWSFRIALFRTGSQVYRFIFATRRPGPAFERAFTATRQSFSRLSRAEAASLRPLKVRVVTVRSGQTIETFAQRMRGTDIPRQLFVVLNGLKADSALAPGTAVKVVAE